MELIIIVMLIVVGLIVVGLMQLMLIILLGPVLRAMPTVVLALVVLLTAPAVLALISKHLPMYVPKTVLLGQPNSMIQLVHVTIQLV